MACKDSMQAAFDMLLSIYKNGNKLLICGNGGSAADADHIAGELMKGFLKKRPLPESLQQALGAEVAQNLQCGLAAISLPGLTGLNTAYANDCNPDYIYAQSTLALGQPGDALLCISTSGNAKNVLLAAKVAKAKGMHTLGLTGKNGIKLKEAVDICVSVPEDVVYKIQELHLPIYHALTLALEDEIFP